MGTPYFIFPFLGGYSGVAITLLQLAIAATSYRGETSNETRVKYSKFADDDGSEKSVSSRFGMLIIYTPALVTSIAFCFVFPHLLGQETNLAQICCFIHFLKRDMEVLFLHKYSGKMPQSMAIMIGITYALYTCLICTVATPSPSDVLTFYGSCLFVIGEIGNFYHHYLLANLRSGNHFAKEERKYVAPRGGLFNFVAAPHYLFELVAWYGIAMLAEHSNAFLVAIGMTSYLSGRAKSQNDWNRTKFSKVEWPSDRGNLVPFLF